MTMDVNENLKNLDIVLPEVPSLGGVYSPVKCFGSSMAYVSGSTSRSSTEKICGRLGADLTVEQGQHAARISMLNLLAVLRKNLGDLNRIKCFVKILGFVRCTEDFGEQPKVMNGASQLLRDAFGERAGLPARSAIGTNALPGGAAVEIEALVELKD
jgi:enamine deaminase RidA (YjgF/YER057c/UK114 family)